MAAPASMKGGISRRTVAGNGYVTANFAGTATFGAGEPNQTTLNSAGSGDIVVAKYDPSGGVVPR